MDLEKSYARTKVLLLGGAGFIGSNLAEAFVHFGAKVTIIDGFVQHTGASTGNIKSFLSQIDLYDCRVENLDRLPELVNTSDLIIDSMAQSLNDNIKNLNNQLLSSMNKVNGCSNDKLLLLFQKDFPIDESEINYHQLDFMMCKDSKKLMATLSSGDFLLVTDMQKDEIFKNTIDALTNSGKINLISTLNAKRCYPLVGGITAYKAYLYQVN